MRRVHAVPASASFLGPAAIDLGGRLAGRDHDQQLPEIIAIGKLGEPPSGQSRAQKLSKARKRRVFLILDARLAARPAASGQPHQPIEVTLPEHARLASPALRSPIPQLADPSSSPAAASARVASLTSVERPVLRGTASPPFPRDPSDRHGTDAGHSPRTTARRAGLVFPPISFRSGDGPVPTTKPPRLAARGSGPSLSRPRIKAVDGSRWHAMQGQRMRNIPILNISARQEFSRARDARRTSFIGLVLLVLAASIARPAHAQATAAPQAVAPTCSVPRGVTSWTRSVELSSSGA